MGRSNRLSCHLLFISIRSVIIALEVTEAQFDKFLTATALYLSRPDPLSLVHTSCRLQQTVTEG